jgi:hypothetical protein
VRLTPDLALRLARLSKDLSQMQRTVEELLAAVERPRVGRRSRNPVESAQYAVLEAALRTPQATVCELHGQVEGPAACTAGASFRRSASRT